MTEAEFQAQRKVLDAEFVAVAQDDSLTPQEAMLKARPIAAKIKALYIAAGKVTK